MVSFFGLLTSYHGLCDLKQQKFILMNWRLGVQTQCISSDTLPLKPLGKYPSSSSFRILTTFLVL